jgi:hypothetical protein
MAANERHYERVSALLMEGEVIPFLGAGANLCDRPDGADWEPGVFLPNGTELAEALAQRSGYPVHPGLDLLRVSQYVDAVFGEGRLYKDLHHLFDADYPPSSLHRFLARMPRMLRESDKPPLLIVTTNYDDALERAFAEQNEEYDLVWYAASKHPKQERFRGKFIHRPPGAEPIPIDVPNEYDLLTDRTVILKLHGAIDRAEQPNWDSFVIAEDNYIDYLTQGDISAEIPMTLRDRIGDAHLLFLGYSLRDWNLRVILARICGREPLYKSWAVQREPDDPNAKEIEEELWKGRGQVELHYAHLKEYVAELSERMFERAPADAVS